MTEPANETGVLGAKLRRIREARDLTREQAAVAAGISASTLTRAERSEAIGYRTLVKIARVLEVPVSDIYEHAEDEVAPDGAATARADQLESLLRDVISSQAEILRIVRKIAAPTK